MTIHATIPIHVTLDRTWGRWRRSRTNGFGTGVILIERWICLHQTGARRGSFIRTALVFVHQSCNPGFLSGYLSQLWIARMKEKSYRNEMWWKKVEIEREGGRNFLMRENSLLYIFSKKKVYEMCQIHAVFIKLIIKWRFRALCFSHSHDFWLEM